MRFYDVLSGSIKVGGIDIRDVTISSLREVFGFVPQNAVLFNETIMDNVRYGRLDATDEEVYAACRAASIHDRILSFPKGYRTKTGERGVKLSGGELQRVAIVLCLGKPNVSLYLIDEPSSFLDSEQRIIASKVIKRFILHAKKTAFVIEHDFIMATYLADRVIVFEGQPAIAATATP